LALVALLISLFLSMKEILLSVSALNIELDSIEMIHTDPKKSHR
jgi:hypothetical protein